MRGSKKDEEMLSHLAPWSQAASTNALRSRTAPTTPHRPLPAFEKASGRESRCPSLAMSSSLQFSVSISSNYFPLRAVCRELNERQEAAMPALVSRSMLFGQTILRLLMPLPATGQRARSAMVVGDQAKEPPLPPAFSGASGAA
jgi:hypothetical protein